jgi:hypothetical protein
MAQGYEVLNMLIPQGGWSIEGDDFNKITFHTCSPITKKQFEDGFAAFDAWKAKESADNAAAKAALLDRLGISADEAKLLLS